VRRVITHAALLTLSVLITLPALFYGSVELWATTLFLYIALFAFVLVLILRHPLNPPRTVKVLFVLSTVPLFFAVVQVIPLPLGLLSSLSPEAAEVYRIGGVEDYAPLTLSVQKSLNFILQCGAAFFAFWAAAFLIRGRRKTLFILSVIAVATAVYAFYGFLDAFSGAGSMENIRSTFVGYTHFGAFAGLGLFAAVALLFSLLPKETDWRSLLRTRKNFHIKLLVGFLILILALGLLFSVSRGAIGAAAVAALLVLLMRGAPETRWQRRAALLLIVGAFLSLALYFDIEPIIIRYKQTLQRTQMRPIIWASAIRLIPSFALTGCGFYSFRYAFSPHKSDPRLTGIYEEAHNDYLNFVIEGGIVTLAVILLFLFLYIKSVHPLLSSERRHKVYAGLCAISVCVFVALQSFVDFQLHIPAVAILFATLTGSALGLLLENRKSETIGMSQKRLLFASALLIPSVFIVYFSAPFLTAEKRFDEATALYREGEKKGDEEKLKEAEELFGEVIRSARFMDDAYFRAARVSVLLGDETEAEVHFLQALRLCPADARYHYHYALLLGRTGREEEAIERLKEAIKLDPTYIRLYLEAGRRFLSLAKERGDEELLSEGLDILRKAVRVSPGVLDGVLDTVYKEFPQRKYLRMVVEGGNRVGYLRFLLKKGRYRALVREAESSSSTGESADADLLYLRGVGYLNTGREEKALTDFREYINAAPNRYEAIKAVHKTFARFRKWWEAYEFWSTLKEDVYPYDVRINEIEALMRLRKYRQAWERLKLLSMDGSVEVYELMYRCALCMGRRKMALEYLQMLSRMRPDNIEYMFRIAHHLRGDGRLEEALLVVNDILRSRPGDKKAMELRAELKRQLLFEK